MATRGNSLHLKPNARGRERLARIRCRLDVHVVRTCAQVRDRWDAARADQRGGENGYRSKTRLAQVWASREAPAGPTLHGVSKSVTPQGVCPQLQMCSSRTERGGVR